MNETLQEVAKRILANNIDGLKDALQDDDLFFFYKGVIQCYGEAMAQWQKEQYTIEEQIADEFAIGFAEFSINYNYHPMHKVWIRYDKMANEKFTTKELLEIYKKEKAL